MSSVGERVLLMLECVLSSSSSDLARLGSSAASGWVVVVEGKLARLGCVGWWLRVSLLD